jgi:hypothetical protein
MERFATTQNKRAETIYPGDYRLEQFYWRLTSWNTGNLIASRIQPSDQLKWHSVAIPSSELSAMERISLIVHGF